MMFKKKKIKLKVVYYFNSSTNKTDIEIILPPILESQLKCYLIPSCLIIFQVIKFPENFIRRKNHMNELQHNQMVQHL